MIEDQLKAAIRDVPDFPKPGILFKDITPVLSDSLLTQKIYQHLIHEMKPWGAQVVIGVESRGFFFGLPLSWGLSASFVPVRKPGKLPYDKIEQSYDLEYGSAKIEMHKDAIQPGQKVIIHDDLLATGGTAIAAANLVDACGGQVVGFSFLVNLSFLNGIAKLENISDKIHVVANYD